MEIKIDKGKESCKRIKCVVWDLDNTIWNGILLEDKNVTLRNGVTEIIKTLDSRGILQSIASRNDYNSAMEKLKEFKLDEYFIYPQIGWKSKSTSVLTIANLINIGTDTLAFIDDQQFEREEVSFSIPEVLCIDAIDLSRLVDMPEMIPRFLTDDSKNRRIMYMSDIKRNLIEEKFDGPQEKFLESLEMELTIAPVEEGDLERAEELTVRTHQLNTTGYTYSYEELKSFSSSDRYKLFIMGLNDKYGTYGKIGLIFMECDDDVWIIKLLLMSCRVMSRGVGTVVLNYIMKMAKDKGVKLRAEFVPTDKNRMMYVTYKFAGFREVEENDSLVVFENSLERIQGTPNYIKLKVNI